MKISKKLRIEFNKRFASGEQYIEINLLTQKIESIEKKYYWEQRAVYNRILPIIEHFTNKYKDIHILNFEELIYGENGLVERLIPLQREYNNAKNKKNEFIERLSFGFAFVEDGSVDIDEFAEEGLAPGKIIIYRQGSTAPSVIQPDVTPYSIYNEELGRIEKEIGNIRVEFQNNVLEANKV